MTSRLLDALPIAAALVEPDGTVGETNVAWRTLGVGHRVPCPQPGGNVFRVLDPLAQAGDGLAREVRAGLTQVLAVTRSRVEIDYDVAAEEGFHHYRLELRSVTAGCVATHVDVSRHWRAVVLAEQHAREDPLTGLDNRRGLSEPLARAVRISPSRPATLLVVDLDDFKLVNDRFGHAVGDHLLQRLARRLTRSVRPGDLVARLGGDEFVVLAPGLSGSEAIDAFVERLRAAIEAPLDEDGHCHRVGASIGAVLLDGGVPDATTALALADQRMYREKRQRARLTEFDRSA